MDKPMSCCCGRSELPRERRVIDAGNLSGEQLAHVGESFELERVAARVEHKERGLLADLTLEADSGFNDERDTGGAQTLRDFMPLVHAQYDAEMRYRHIVAVYRVMAAHAGLPGAEMRHDLVTIQIEIYPGGVAASFRAAEDAAIESARRSQIVNGKGVMERVFHNSPKMRVSPWVAGAATRN